MTIVQCDICNYIGKGKTLKDKMIDIKMHEILNNHDYTKWVSKKIAEINNQTRKYSMQSVFISPPKFKKKVKIHA